MSKQPSTKTTRLSLTRAFKLSFFIGLIILLLGRVFLKVNQPLVGYVQGDDAPLTGASVRIKTSDNVTVTNEDGKFIIDGYVPKFTVHLTAWKEGHYIGGVKIYPWTKMPVQIPLFAYVMDDNPDYPWVPPSVDNRSKFGEFLVQTLLSVAAEVSFDRVFLPLAGKLELGCHDCHGNTINEQWAASAHALGNKNARFLTMYNGTDIHGNQSLPTVYFTHRDYGRTPLRPDINQSYFGPGYKLDFPDSAGNCATCHLPTAALIDPYGIDPNEVTGGIDALGVHCDFCHKIAGTNFNPLTRKPFENFPGILSLDLLRPSPEPQLFFGPYDDVDVGPDTFLPLIKQSEFCAACHDASFWGVPIYQSFSEWKNSPYAEEGITCQSCHMAPDGVTTNFAPGRGGVERDPATIPSHNFPGASDMDLLQNTAELSVDFQRQDGKLFVDVKVTNTGAGHHIPTDSPLRQIFLIVSAKDENGMELDLLEGSLLPWWAGDLANQPGRYYAKILEQLWTEVSPTSAYWTQTRIVEDTRLPARATDISRYQFISLNKETIFLEVKLVFRRAYYEIIQQKNWDDQDILMEIEVIEVPSLIQQEKNGN